MKRKKILYSQMSLISGVTLNASISAARAQEKIGLVGGFQFPTPFTECHELSPAATFHLSAFHRKFQIGFLIALSPALKTF